jgi:hypothetical protein
MDFHVGIDEHYSDSNRLYDPSPYMEVITMSELNNYFLTIDVEKAIDDLEKVEEKRKEVEKDTKDAIKTVDKEVASMRRHAVNAMQGTWHALEGMMRSVGITMPQLLRSVISGTFAAIKLLTPILTAEAVTPGMQIQAAIGFSQVALSIVAAAAAQREAAEQENSFNNINSVLGSINSLIGAWNF